MGDGLESFMAEGQEAGCAGWIEDDQRGTLVRCGIAWETTRCGKGSSDTGDGIVDGTGVDGRGSSDAGDGIFDRAGFDRGRRAW